MSRPVLFEHIPKSGGITLRGILQKKYGESHVFFINSNNPASSLAEFSGFSGEARRNIKVIAGHGALMYKPLLSNPFTITILREPVKLFFSQFNYLKITERNQFWNEVKKMDTAEEYLDYALTMGQDNLMTRFLSNSMQWTVDPGRSFDDMNHAGDDLLSAAKNNLKLFDAVINLNDFDAGIFALGGKLGWQSRIPVYKPSNRTLKKKNTKTYSAGFQKKLRHVLRFDLELYDYFLKNKLAVSYSVNQKSIAFRLFQARQIMAKYAALALNKN